MFIGILFFLLMEIYFLKWSKKYIGNMKRKDFDIKNFILNMNK